jgi:hypothetical protein
MVFTLFLCLVIDPEVWYVFSFLPSSYAQHLNGEKPRNIMVITIMVFKFKSN